jgi:hypothetical protein
VSERIGGQTWSGISRRYRITPMVPGTFALPPQPVVVTYADPQDSTPRHVTLETNPLTFTGVVPKVAEDLDPFVAAETLTLEQTIDGDPAAMTPGDSVTRTVVATVAGTSPMFVPDLLAPVTIDGIAAYPDEPALSETAERGTLGGTRTESVTFVAEGGGSGEVPPVSIEWLNLTSGAVETATAAGFAIHVAGAPARRAAPTDWRAIGLAVLIGAVAVTALAWAIRRAVPPLRARQAERRAHRLASEAHAFAGLERAVRRRDHATLRQALDLWASRTAGPDPRDDPAVHAALTALGAARYGGASDRGEEGAAWNKLARALPDARRATNAPAAATRPLPALNPL